MHQQRQNKPDSEKGDGGKQQQQRSQVNSKRQEVQAEVEEITSNYPDATADYEAFINENIDTWKSEIEEIKNQYGSGNNDGSRKMKFFENMSDPVWLIVWDPDKPFLRR